MSNNNNNSESAWTTVGAKNKQRNLEKRKLKRKQAKLDKKREIDRKKRYEKEREIYQQKRKDDWRQKRINLIQQRDFEEYKSRRITTQFAQAIQHERSVAKMTRKELALKIMIQESELAFYENGTKCPSSHLVVELRKVFENLPRKYFLISN